MELPPLAEPVLHVLAGSNGAGKSTFVTRVLQPVTRLPFVNADVIAAQRWPGEEAERSYDAAAIAATQRAELLEARASFITETVFSHASKVEFLRQAQAARYLITLHVILVPEELTVARVGHRVRSGGHTVPEDKIRSRYERLWAHVGVALALAEDAFVYDNSSARTPFRQVAAFHRGGVVGSPDWPAWTPLDLRRAGDAEGKSPDR